MATSTIPLSLTVDVTVNVGAQPPAAPTFNQGLIVSPTTVIPASQRVAQYGGTSAMLQAGFQANDPALLAAQLYFGQTPAPQVLWVACQVATAIQTAEPTAASEGTGYKVGDILTVTQTGASGGQLQVTTIGTNGAVTGVAPVQANQGQGYSVANGLATTGGSGTGAEVDITAIGETPLQAVQAARLASSQWWGFFVTSAQASDHLAIATWAQSATPQCFYFYSTQNTADSQGGSSTLFAEMQALTLNRTAGLYSTTQGGGFPNNAYAGADVLGMVMGLNTGLPNSYFNTKFKPLVGVAGEPITLTQLSSIEGQNGNVYISVAGQYNWMEQGVCANGQYIDEILNLDMLASDIQTSVVDVFTSLPSVPQNEAGETLLINAVNGACDRAVTRGFISPGIWDGETVMNVASGTSLPKGYLCQSQPFSQQSKADRAARKMMPITVCIIETGSGNSVSIGVFVQQ